jgi:hypothetical protein
LAVSLNHDVMTSFGFENDQEVPQNLTQAVRVKLFEATVLCPWTADQCAQTLCVCLRWMGEAV